MLPCRRAVSVDQFASVVLGVVQELGATRGRGSTGYREMADGRIGGRRVGDYVVEHEKKFS